MDDCIFCKIIKGEVPCFKVYEDEDTLAFLDIQPVNPGHTLVIPKKHVANIFDIDEETLNKVNLTIKKVSPIIIKAVGAQGLNIMQNNGKVSGQLVMHAHHHIIPRFEGDGLKHWSHKKYKSGEAENILKDISKIMKQ